MASGTSCSFTTTMSAAAVAAAAMRMMTKTKTTLAAAGRAGRLLFSVCSLRSNVKKDEERNKNGATDLLGTKILCIIPSSFCVECVAKERTVRHCERTIDSQ